MAFGGKRENGAWKEKKACIAVLGFAGGEFAIVCGVFEARKERNVKKTIVREKAVAMIILGGRMMGFR